MNTTLQPNATLNETIEPLQLIQPLSSSLPSSSPSFLSTYWYLIVVIIILLVWKFLKRKNTTRDLIYLVGERNSGKTQLFLKLTKGKQFPTVPSVKNNLTKSLVNNRLKTYVDVTGDNHSKEEFLNGINRAWRIILMVDGANTGSFAATAELIYRIVANKEFQKNEPEFVVALNKKDKVEYVGGRAFKKQIQDQVERIKLSRKALHEEKETEEDFLREQKARYTMPYKIIELSVLEKIDAVEQFILEGAQL